jgi:hypothetical protein
MSVSSKFEAFCLNISISSNSVSNIEDRYRVITKRLNRDFWNSDSDTYHSLYVGSYGRDTDIHVSDIDMLFWLPDKIYEQCNKHQGNGQSALLQTIRKSLEKTYSTSHLRGDGQVVVIKFSDEIRFEIVPCFENKDDSFKYPDTNNGGSWKITNPRAEINAIREANNKWNKNLKRLCRMAKAWKDEWSLQIGGLLIDSLAYNFMSQSEYKDKSFLYYDYITRDFFEYLKNQSKDQEYWLAPGSEQYVWKKDDFYYKALQCYNLSLEAIEYEEQNKDWSASQTWKQIYGNKFPD